MIKEYQVTLISEGNKYRPVSTIVKTEEIDFNNKIQKKMIVKKGAEKICIKRYWDKTDLSKYGYLKAKVREYDKEKIEQENKERYERIKEEKYLTGEWKRPKNKKD